MPSSSTVKGLALGEMTIGVILIYWGLQPEHTSLGTVLKDLITGTAKAPALGTGTGYSAGQQGAAATVSGGSPSAGTLPSSSNAVQALQQAATSMGWGSGAEWQALNSIEMAEAGYDSTATNPGSGAYGIGQSLGHPFSGGPASNGVNEYGGYGLTPAQSRAASEGQAAPQALWMVRYISSVYGDPIKAWEHEQTDHWY